MQSTSDNITNMLKDVKLKHLLQPGVQPNSQDINKWVRELQTMGKSIPNPVNPLLGYTAVIMSAADYAAHIAGIAGAPHNLPLQFKPTTPVPRASSTTP